MALTKVSGGVLQQPIDVGIVTASNGTFSGNLNVAGVSTFANTINAVDASFSGNVSIAGTLTYEDVTNIDSIGIITARSDVLVGGILNVTGVSTFNTDVEFVGASAGITSAYWDSSANLLNFKDDVKATFGDGDDLQIYHDGSNSWIRDVGTGNLKLDTNGGAIALSKSNGVEILARFVADGASELYYDDSKKFETTGTGVTITGDARVTGILTVGQSSVTIDGTNNKITTPKLDYAGISSSISDTAVDVFVYDTRKDSDGGAWRKRTQHTSWYNETLNTATRGSRREFPAVAVLVLEGTQLTIYDGDDPDLPMWMVFNKQPNSYFAITTNSCISALNGKIASGGNASNDRFRVIDFLLDNEREYSHTDGQRTHLSPISGRNGTAGFTSYDSSLPGVVNRNINDVAMTVLPNAPIDDATGLPIPTIAVATDGGVSVIKDDGTVVDITNGIGNTEVAFIDNNRLMVSRNTQTAVETGVIPTADIAASSWRLDFYNSTSTIATLGTDNAKKISENTSVGGNSGLSLIYENLSSSTNGMVAYATTSYNTGWMHGNIKGAFLSDTDATNVTGTELVTNGDFSSALGSTWIAETGGTTIAINSGVLEVTRLNSTTSGSMSAYQEVTGLEVGAVYVLTGEVTALSFEASIGVGINTSATGYDPNTNTEGHYLSDDWTVGNGRNAVGTMTLTFRAAQSTYYIGLGARSSLTATASFDNISLRKAELDRSVNQKGLQVFGTITKTAVATGAELVAYSNWSASNYLEQPYNSALNYGTGDFYFGGWFKNAGYSDSIIGRLHDSSSAGKGFLLSTASSGASGVLVFAIYTLGFQSSGRTTVGTTTDETGKGWQQVWAIRRGGTMELWLNGNLITTGSNSVDISDTTYNPPLFIGVQHGSSVFDGELALMRTGASAPSAEQIKKMYEDEKVLFQENAACTLYGSSDAVTALAYDDSTNLLYAGTSSGRSDFQGLRRINNTTTAVTTAISASNGLVAEQ